MLAAAAAVAVEEAVAIVVVDDVWLILLNMLAPFRAEAGRGTTEGRDGERERDAMALCKEPDAVDSDSDDGIVLDDVLEQVERRSREGRACTDVL